VVPGSVGAYPLKWTRYWNSHTNYQDHFMGARWRFSYIKYAFYMDRPLEYPDGRTLDWITPNAFGIEDSVHLVGQEATLRLADGGSVIFDGDGNGHFQVTKIVDPYNQATTIVTTGTGNTQTTTITEPGGRYLFVNYNSDGAVSQVQAFDGIP